MSRRLLVLNVALGIVSVVLAVGIFRTLLLKRPVPSPSAPRVVSAPTSAAPALPGQVVPGQVVPAQVGPVPPVPPQVGAPSNQAPPSPPQVRRRILQERPGND